MVVVGTYIDVICSVFLAGAEQGGVPYGTHSLVFFILNYYLATLIRYEGFVFACFVPFVIKQHGYST